MAVYDRIVESSNRFEYLKNATLTKFLDKIDLDSESMNLCDRIIYYFWARELDDDFYSSRLINLSNSDRKKILDLVHEYIGLCFYDGNHDYWLDSVDGIPLKDSEFICLKILDNVNFLVKIAISCGRSGLELLKSFSDKPGYNDTSVVEYLRNSFKYDEVLENIILEMSREDSTYNVFDEKEKAILCSFPQGVLFYEDDYSVKYSNPTLLHTRITNILDSDDDDNNMFEEFEDVVNLLYLDYAR